MFHLKRRFEAFAPTDIASYVLAAGLYGWLIVFGLTRA